MAKHKAADTAPETGASAAASDEIAAMSFEDAMSALEGIVDQLESGRVDLERSIALYERGAALRAHCDAKLKAATMRVEQIVRGEDGGAAGTEVSPLAQTVTEGG